ncbi:MAG TPA: HAD family hydrolase [Mycobacteriales bacterium]|jgi:phosphoglycolate phosphatase-like HAD superfamily hydrolase
MSTPETDAVIFDVDGTLVDSNYQHALAWYRAFRGVQITLPIWRIHRHVGMGGDRIIAALAGDDVERRHGDTLRAGHGNEFARMIDEVAPLDGARDLLIALQDSGIEVTIASSGEREMVDRFLDLIDAGDAVSTVISTQDVGQSKPAPDLVETAAKQARAHSPVMIGDAVWDARSAIDAGVPFVAVLSGGFSAQELLEAGASAVYTSPRDILEHLGDGPLPRQ